MMNRNYKVDFFTNSVMTTKKFMDAASQFGTPEYRILCELRAQGFIITSPAPKKRYASSDWTYAQMRAYICCCQNAETFLAEFEAIMLAAKAQKNPYGFVKKWFNATFPKHAEIPEFDKNFRIIVGQKNEEEGNGNGLTSLPLAG